MYRQYQRQLIDRVRAYLRAQYSLEPSHVVVEQPPRVEMGEYALPLSFELARTLRKAPRKIAEELVAGIGEIEGFEKLEVAGAGYINARLKRAVAAAALAAENGELKDVSPPAGGGKILVEHSSINPNKAAHIGHLRNAILGDTFVRLLRASGREVDVQNYIDNTGVQVADVVVGFLNVAGKTIAEIEAMAKGEAKFDYICWDVYARASQWYAEDKNNVQRRLETLQKIEAGNNEVAVVAELISMTVLRRHLATMERLDIRYDFLPRESEILHLKFWELAFRQLKEKGVIYLETGGPKAGCWVMKRAENSSGNEEGEDLKVIVRSNGTVVYEGKDIAYHLWKFGLLGRDFGYKLFHTYPDGQKCWISTAEEGEQQHPHFGGVAEIYNVIDARQAEAQGAVIEALRGLGHPGAAENYHHFSYEMVALTPRCAADLGYSLSEDDWSRSFIEVSGRKGFGVKADDLMDTLITSAAGEVDSRHAELAAEERRSIAEQIAMGALRYFMLKFTKSTVIAFDFKEALSFEGETGPYAQYAVVRATNIFRKAGVEPEEALAAKVDYAAYLDGESGNEFWELWLAVAKTSYVIDQCVATTEPAYAAKHVFQLGQLFNNFYHRHNILKETDEARKKFLLATVAVVRREMIRVLGMMGIEVPRVM
ncbi:MAG TPA: arginine--tRNA ligase [Terriglobales bacterium]|nr:arginine--tRNA ligase [Terriglobales bacterium]